ncbi:MAG: phosphatase PAP2 family protein [Candidatus Neomarinimicrobiota bacterium]
MLLLLVLLPLQVGFATDSIDQTSVSAHLRDVPGRFLDGLNHTVNDPVNRNIMLASTLLALAALPFDERVSDGTITAAPLTDALARFCDHYGHGWAGVGLGGWLVLTGMTDPVAAAYRLEFAALALATTYQTTAFLKWAVGRERPSGNNRRSFPSGHTSHSFVVATVIDEIYGHRAGIPAYGIAALVATSRVQAAAHYPSDVLFGAGVGTIIGRGFGQIYRAERSRSADTVSWSLVPLGSSLTVILEF